MPKSVKSKPTSDLIHLNSNSEIIYENVQLNFFQPKSLLLLFGTEIEENTDNHLMFPIDTKIDMDCQI